LCFSDGLRGGGAEADSTRIILNLVVGVAEPKTLGGAAPFIDGQRSSLVGAGAGVCDAGVDPGCRELRNA
jgi:hypothetical protein